MPSWTEDYYMLNPKDKPQTALQSINDFLATLKKKKEGLTVKRVGKLSTEGLQELVDSKPVQKLGVSRKKEKTFNTGTRMITLSKEDE